ncbi:MAG TPA: EthD domain-containing protein [Candidatus Limnocylindrales bacterium]|nr:EthD domain-containing protein [Candidatus Limnocylindrales bacterium]
MIKLVYCIRRREAVPSAEFHRYWLHEHGPLVASLAGDLSAVRYVQSHTVAPDLNEMLRQSRGLKAPYDGITEVWWKDEDSFRAALASEQGQAAARALIEDEARFIDLARSRVFLTREHEIF